MAIRVFKTYFPKTLQQQNQNLPTEHSFIIDVFDTEPEACWERAHQDVEVEEERDPRRGLVLRHGCYDGDVDLSIAVGRGGRIDGGEDETERM